MCSGLPGRALYKQEFEQAQFRDKFASAREQPQKDRTATDNQRPLPLVLQKCNFYGLGLG
jgi:hypothetical protein